MAVILFVVGGTPTEYFCLRCRQLRLDVAKVPTACELCGNKDIITGPPTSLDKDALIRKADGLKD